MIRPALSALLVSSSLLALGHPAYASVDEDGDGYGDEIDNCPTVPNGDSVGRSKIFVNNDEWTLSDTGFAEAPETGRFVANVTEWFTGGETGRFLAWSTNFGVTGGMLAATMDDLGHEWTVSTAVPFTAASLEPYDAVFVGGDEVDTDALIAYVLDGGNVYIMAGTGWAGAAAEAAQWNAFMTFFGLQFAPSYNGIGGVRSTANADHVVFDGVPALYSDNGNTIHQTSPTHPDTELVDLLPGGGALFAVYDAAIDGNDGQQDVDQDGAGDVCDPCPTDGADACAAADGDGDGIPDDEDPCPQDPGNPDGDGVCTSADNCELVFNADQADLDGDGQGDACDDDADDDGVPDEVDECLDEEVGGLVDATGCSLEQLCPCDADWKNHGAYVRCVAHATGDLVAAGAISGREKGALVAEAGASECGAR